MFTLARSIVSHIYRKEQYICKNDRPVYQAACKYEYRPCIIEVTADVFIIVSNNNNIWLLLRHPTSNGKKHSNISNLQYYGEI